MSPRILRIAAAVLLSSFVVLACPRPSQAFRGHGRPNLDGPAVTEPERGFFAFLRRLFGFAGGAMDPNG
jgi:hypothetical protein